MARLRRLARAVGLWLIEWAGGALPDEVSTSIAELRAAREELQAAIALARGLELQPEALAGALRHALQPLIDRLRFDEAPDMQRPDDPNYRSGYEDAEQACAASLDQLLEALAMQAGTALPPAPPPDIGGLERKGI